MIAEDFFKYAKSKNLNVDLLKKIVQQQSNTIAPVILEERKMNVAAMDVFSRLLYDRIIYFGDDFNRETCNIIIAQLLYLNSLNNDDISIYINSNGGSVVDGLGVIDTINYIDSQVSTICVGTAASMGAVLLSSGQKGKRYALPHSRIMIHQVSSQMQGTFSDLKIEFEQTERCKHDLYKILATNLNKPYEEIERLCDRDNWFIGEEAKELGIIDEVLIKK